MVSVDVIELVTNEGTKLGLRYAKVLGITLGAMDIIELDTYDGSDIGKSEFSTDENVDRKFEGLLLKAWLGSVVGLEFWRVIDTTLGVIEGLILGTYSGIELGLS